MTGEDTTKTNISESDKTKRRKRAQGEAQERETHRLTLSGSFPIHPEDLVQTRARLRAVH